MVATECRGGTEVVDTGAYLVLDANTGDRSRPRMCRVVISDKVDGWSYDVRVTLLNRKRPGQAGVGNPGVAYNVRDSDNFDFVIFRYHAAKTQ